MISCGEIRDPGFGNLFGFTSILLFLCILHQFPGQFVIDIQIMIGKLFIQPLIRDNPCELGYRFKLVAGRRLYDICDLIYSDRTARDRLAFWRVDLKPQRSGMITIYKVANIVQTASGYEFEAG